MPCSIGDRYGYMSPTGSFVPLPNQTLYCVPSSPDYRVSFAGTYRPLVGLNPNISSAPLRYGVVAATDSNGEFSFVLPYGGGESNPAQPPMRWTLVYPDGSQLSGVVPSVAGPVSADDLIANHGWSWVSSVYIAPVTPGTLARGTVSFSGSSSTATVVFLTPFSTNTYQLTLTPSVDANDGSMPQVAWSGKTATGFTINVGPSSYVGSVDFEAKL